MSREHAPRPEAVGAGFDDRRERDRLTAKRAARRLELTLERPFVDAGSDQRRRGQDALGGRVRCDLHLLDLVANEWHFWHSDYLRDERSVLLWQFGASYGNAVQDCYP